MTSMKIPAFNDWPNDIGFTTHEEQSDPIDLEVIGTIPAYVSGTLYRASTAGNSIPLSETTTLPLSHWFDGLATVHRFTISPPSSGTAAKITHASRLTSSGILTRVRRTGSLSGFTFGQKHDPCESLYAKFKSCFFSSNGGFSTADKGDDDEIKSCMNVGVTISTDFPGTGADGKAVVVAKTDSTVMQLLNASTLKPEGYLTQKTLHPDLRGPLSAAHARTDPLTGDLYNYNLDLRLSTKYRVFRTHKDTGATEVLATIKDAPPAYVHSFWISENYLVLCIWNSHFAWGGAKCLWEKNLVDAIADWDPHAKCFFYVIDRKGGRGVVARFVDNVPFFVFHTIGAWEEGEDGEEGNGGDLVLEALSYDNVDVIKRFYYENILATNVENGKSWIGRGRTKLTRWRLPNILKTKGNLIPAVRESSVAGEWGMELPTINPLFVTKKNRYIYGITSTAASNFMDGILKYDTATNSATHWQVHAHTPGEAVFVPDPSGTAEDDGVLLSVVLDGVSGRSYLLVLDARDMTEVARAETKIVIGFGFHGKWDREGVLGVEC